VRSTLSSAARADSATATHATASPVVHRLVKPASPWFGGCQAMNRKKSSFLSDAETNARDTCAPQKSASHFIHRGDYSSARSLRP